MAPPKAMTSYTHPAERDQVETADTQPGYYYVLAIEGHQNAVLLGPFLKHQEALDWVVACRDRANELYPQSHFYRFGTCRQPLETDPKTLPTGGFNDVFSDAPGLINHKQGEQA